MAEGSLPRKTPDFGDWPPGMPTKLYPPLDPHPVCLTPHPQVAEAPRGRARGYLRGQRALPRDAGSGARRGRGAGPARLAGAGGSGRSRRRTRIPPASPARSPEGTEPKSDCYPIIATCTVATMPAGNPESRAAGAPHSLESTSPGGAVPRGAGGGQEAGRPTGVAARGAGGEASTAERPQLRRPSPVATRPPPRRDESGFFPVRGPGPAAPSPSPRGLRAAPLAPWSPRPRAPGPAAIPPGAAARSSGLARRLRWAGPPRAPSLRHRGSGPGLRRLPSAPAPPRSPACPCCRNGSGDVSAWSLGLGPG